MLQLVPPAPRPAPAIAVSEVHSASAVPQSERDWAEHVRGMDDMSVYAAPLPGGSQQGRLYDEPVDPDGMRLTAQFYGWVVRVLGCAGVISMAVWA